MRLPEVNSLHRWADGTVMLMQYCCAGTCCGALERWVWQEALPAAVLPLRRGAGLCAAVLLDPGDIPLLHVSCAGMHLPLYGNLTLAQCCYECPELELI